MTSKQEKRAKKDLADQTDGKKTSLQSAARQQIDWAKDTESPEEGETPEGSKAVKETFIAKEIRKAEEQKVIEAAELARAARIAVLDDTVLHPSAVKGNDAIKALNSYENYVRTILPKILNSLALDASYNWRALVIDDEVFGKLSPPERVKLWHGFVWRTQKFKLDHAGESRRHAQKSEYMITGLPIGQTAPDYSVAVPAIENTAPAANSILTVVNPYSKPKLSAKDAFPDRRRAEEMLEEVKRYARGTPLKTDPFLHLPSGFMQRAKNMIYGKRAQKRKPGDLSTYECDKFNKFCGLSVSERSSPDNSQLCQDAFDEFEAVIFFVPAFFADEAKESSPTKELIKALRKATKMPKYHTDGTIISGKSVEDYRGNGDNGSLSMTMC
jgi:hypothetical protein